jgi:hypothetical protein
MFQGRQNSIPWRSPAHGEEDVDFAALAVYLNSVELICWTRSAYQIANPGCVITVNWEEEAPWRILSGDQGLCGSRSRGAEAMRRDFEELRTYLGKLMPGQTADPTQLSKGYNMYRMAIGKQHNRRPFVSSMGYIGLVPAQGEKEDVICIVEGACMPFVFRRAGDVHKLVGEAYVYGIMDGEFMESSLPMEIFHVC